MPNSRRLTELEEKTIIEYWENTQFFTLIFDKYVLDLDARSFPPPLCDIEDMAN
ncbi:hypothetical protein BGZ61DRAFT_570690 [Ilyonectria robusta]|uniref:uncharacterized protein n=1 Tax=Ilyonectria robusta TaxID=1079257 RepID=UPI001E8E590F|nr:uncharacterized protein BGZ61DRAFT_570690 [Ilyonectria robusta]KAH8656351.1 hypothetical protein BGZ61DRAFT_570690 [Ilyonectria robusta]